MATKLKLDIFQYSDYQAFLRDWFAQQKSTNRLTLPQLAETLALRSKGYLHRVFNAPDRPISPDLVSRLALYLKLGRSETAYFEALVSFCRAKNAEDKAMYYARMHAVLGPRVGQSIEPDHYEYFRNWYMPVVREVVCFRNWKNDFAKIAQAIEPPITTEQAKSAVELMLKVGLLQRHRNGTFSQVDTILSTGHDMNSPALLEFHTSSLELAQRSLRTHNAQNREIAAVTLGIPHAALTEYKALMRRFLVEAANLSTIVPGKPDSVYQINIQCIPLTVVKDAK